MESSAYNWTVGEIANLPRTSSVIKEGNTKSYEHFAGSNYLCVREPQGQQMGILVKVLGKVDEREVMLINGEPFSKDDKGEYFLSTTYYSYQYPTTAELKEALDAIRRCETLLKKFDEASMHININSTFWVRETARHLLFQRKLQYYDSRSGKVLISSGKIPQSHYRLALAYFNKSSIGR